MDIQRLRNLTTGILHTNMDDVREDLEFITGQSGLLARMIPRVMRAIEPWLASQITDPRFFDGQCDLTHTGDHPLRQMTQNESDEAFARYMAMPKPCVNTPTTIVKIPQ